MTSGCEPISHPQNQQQTIWAVTGQRIVPMPCPSLFSPFVHFVLQTEAAELELTKSYESSPNLGFKGVVTQMPS